MSISRRGPPFPACALTRLLLPQCTRFQVQGNVSGRFITCRYLMVKSTPSDREGRVRLQEDLAAVSHQAIQDYNKDLGLFTKGGALPKLEREFSEEPAWTPARTKHCSKALHFPRAKIYPYVKSYMCRKKTKSFFPLKKTKHDKPRTTDTKAPA